MGRAALAVAVAMVVLVAGCIAPPSVQNEGTTTSDTPTVDPSPTRTGSSPDNATHPSDPETDRLGWENGYWYNETIDVTHSDGYTLSEIRPIIARAMARIEMIRELEFQRNVTVEVITREEYRERNVFPQEPNPFQNQVYEAAFLVNESTDAADALSELYGGSVAGYYYDDRIVVVSEDPNATEVSRATLVHELVHAIQDQHGLSVGNGPKTTDAAAARTALSEGEANFVMDSYLARCGSEWECIPSTRSGTSPRSFNRGLFLTLFVPYSDGPTFVQALFERGGWAAVTEAYENPPTSTEQVIHPQTYPDERPVDVSIADRSGPDWERVTGPRGTSDTLGEATLFAMFWFNGIINESHLTTDRRRYNYSHPVSAGWAGDEIVVYRDDGEFGYVFETVWDTERDAEQFHAAYVELLSNRGASEVTTGIYRIPDDHPFGDAFRVERTGRTVRIVNAPTVDELDEIATKNDR